MKKIPTLYRRDHDTGRVVDEITPGCEWVLGDGVVATEKIDGTCCRIQDGKLWKRYDRKPAKKHRVRRARREPFSVEHAKPAPDGWEACQSAPDPVTGHWPGWLLVDFEAPEDRWHAEAFGGVHGLESVCLAPGTHELIGPMVQGNPYGLQHHQLVKHGEVRLAVEDRSFDGLRFALGAAGVEGFVFYSLKHWGDPDWMVKIKASDFGIDWIAARWAKKGAREGVGW